MLFTPKCFPRNMNDLLINGSRISEVNETKFLGVIIDNKLNWSPHIMYISKKIAKGIGIILKARKVFNNETLFSLYYTFVYPYLNYCIHVWGKTYHTHLHHLIVLQNKVIRMINAVPPRTDVDNLYVLHDILSVKRLYSYNVALFTNIQINCLLMCLIIFFPNLLMFTNIIPEMHPLKMCTYVSKEQPVDKKLLSYCGARISNYVLDNVDSNCAIGLFRKRIQRLFLFSNDDLLTWFSKILMH